MRKRPAAIFLVLAATVILLAANPQWVLPSIGGWLMLPADPLVRHENEAIVVLGGGGQQRLREGIALWKEHPESELWHTGDLRPESQRNFVDPTFARTYAVERGVAEEKISLLQSTSTWEDAIAVAAEAERSGVEHLVVVTNYFHSRRAMCVLRHHLAESDITLTYIPPSSDEFNPTTWWQNEQDLVDVAEEWLKIVLYWQRYGVAPWTC